MQRATLGGRRGVSWRRAAPARLPGWRLCFDKPGLLGLGEAYATIVPDPRAATYGVAFEITTDDLAHIEWTEGVPLGNYRRVAVRVTALGSRERLPAVTLASAHRRPGTRPTTRYMELVIAGAIEHGLPAAHVARLRRVPTREEGPALQLLRPVLDAFLRRRRP